MVSKEMLKTTLPIAVSILSLVVSVGSLYVSADGYFQKRIPPEVFAKLESFKIQKAGTKLLLTAEVVVSVSNKSTSELFIASCNFATSGMPNGVGYIEGYSPCGLTNFNLSLPVASGQTQFLAAKYSETLYEGNATHALDAMGIEWSMIREDLERGPCEASFSTSLNSWGMSEICGMVSDNPNDKAFDLVIQTGTGNVVKTPILFRGISSWPWAR